MTIKTQHTTLESLGRDQMFVSDRVVARLILDRAIKRGRLEEAELVAEIATVLARKAVLRGPLQQAAGDALVGHKSGSDADYALARDFLDGVR